MGQSTEECRGELLASLSAEGGAQLLIQEMALHTRDGGLIGCCLCVWCCVCSLAIFVLAFSSLQDFKLFPASCALQPALCAALGEADFLVKSKGQTSAACLPRSSDTALNKQTAQPKLQLLEAPCTLGLLPILFGEPLLPPPIYKELSFGEAVLQVTSCSGLCGG